MRLNALEKVRQFNDYEAENAWPTNDSYAKGTPGFSKTSYEDR